MLFWKEKYYMDIGGMKMWVVVIIGIIIIFMAWCKFSVTAKAFIALVLVLAAPFTEYMSFALLVILVILTGLFGRYFQ